MSKNVVSCVAISLEHFFYPVLLNTNHFLINLFNR